MEMGPDDSSSDGISITLKMESAKEKLANEKQQQKLTKSKKQNDHNKTSGQPSFSRNDVARNPQPVFVVTELSSALESKMIPDNELAPRKVDISQSIAGVESSGGDFSMSLAGKKSRKKASEESEYSIDGRIPDVGAEAKRALESSDEEQPDMSSFDATDAKHRNVPNASSDESGFGPGGMQSMQR